MYYRIVNEHDILFIAVYVDDLLYMFNNEKPASFVKEKVAVKEIHVEYISTEFMLADALTKGLHRPKLCHLTVGMGLRSGEGVGMNA